MAIQGHFAVRGTQICLLMWIDTTRQEQEHFMTTYFVDFEFLLIKFLLGTIYLKFDKVIGISCHIQVSQSTIKILLEPMPTLNSRFTSPVGKKEMQVLRLRQLRQRLRPPTVIHYE